MFVRRVKRKCNVRGCRNTECFAISRTREVGNTIIICKDCLSSGLESIGEIGPKTKSNIPTLNHKDIPALFFNAAANGTADSVSTANDDINEKQKENETNKPQDVKTKNAKPQGTKNK